MQVDFPEILLPFLESPKRNIVAHGGRGGLKTYGCCDAALMRAATRFERVICLRETMDSIDESVHYTLEQRIRDLNLGDKYRDIDSGISGIMKYSIKGPWWCDSCQLESKKGPCKRKRTCRHCRKASQCDGQGRQSEFIFAGLRHNVHNIKSLEGATLAWVEEAQAVSKHSWDTLLPTIRWEEQPKWTCPHCNRENVLERRISQVWVTFNPLLSTDDTYTRWVLPGTTKHTEVIYTTYLDNPWFPEVLRVQMEEAKLTNQEDYEHIWLGKPTGSVVGAIFREEMKKTTDEGRICNVPYSRSRPVDTIWDLGYGDLTAIWFVQAYDGYFNLIDYHEGDGKTIHDYLIDLQARGYLYGTDWLPHDAVDTIIHKRLGGMSDMSIEQLMRKAGRKVRIVPKVLVSDRINAARTIFPQCRFDADKCADGLEALRHYQWGEKNEHGVTKRVPLHNQYSHAADAFTEVAVAVKMPKVEPPKKPAPPPKHYSERSYAPFG